MARSGSCRCIVARSVWAAPLCPIRFAGSTAEVTAYAGLASLKITGCEHAHRRNERVFLPWNTILTTPAFVNITVG